MDITFKTLREKAGLTYKELAQKVGVKPGTIQKYECSCRIPKNTILFKLEESLNCTNEELMQAYAFHKKKNLLKNKKSLGV